MSASSHQFWSTVAGATTRTQRKPATPPVRAALRSAVLDSSASMSAIVVSVLPSPIECASKAPMPSLPGQGWGLVLAFGLGRVRVRVRVRVNPDPTLTL